jgi:hypothetical protein
MATQLLDSKAAARLDEWVRPEDMVHPLAQPSLTTHRT